MQHEPAVNLHGPAKMDGHGLQGVAILPDADLLEQRLQVHFNRSVDNDSQGALVVVLADERQRPGEMRIRHVGHGDEEVMCEVHLLHTTIRPRSALPRVEWRTLRPLQRAELNRSGASGLMVIVRALSALHNCGLLRFRHVHVPIRFKPLLDAPRLTLR